jgi:hypothetical protein
MKTEEPPKREWKHGHQYAEEKRDGVRDVLTRASYDKPYRDRLCSKDPEKVKTAFNEEGHFEELPPDFNITCWEREGVDDLPTDNTVILVLPKYSPQKPSTPPDVDEGWKCTWPAY